MLITKLHKTQHRLGFYLTHILGAMSVCRPYYRSQRPKLLRAYHQLADEQKQAILERVNYYHALNEHFVLPKTALRIEHFQKKGEISSYYYDLINLLKYFPQHLQFLREFGDVIHVPKEPTFVKSRPIAGNRNHAIILKLDSVRHFYIYPDKVPFQHKRSQLIWRGTVHQPHRHSFIDKHLNNPLCDVGCVDEKSIGLPYHKPFMSIQEQLQYKYVLSLEGNDVATNLKWILASQSLCIMPKPKYETWLMEGKLVAGQHYVEIKDDYSDLDEKIAYYEQHPAEALAIIQAANAYMRPFLNPVQERLISLLVLQKYFSLSHQLPFTQENN